MDYSEKLLPSFRPIVFDEQSLGTAPICTSSTAEMLLFIEVTVDVKPTALQQK